ncbi:DUF4244 domain-containing protein [Nonomuraea sp. NPDC000554]|uniref:DUF4244 domain-containing protein n=1 Tax=Nonomuraea sp. NPDC000554 TaxID=3154259 RepID=UPI003333D66D
MHDPVTEDTPTETTPTAKAAAPQTRHWWSTRRALTTGPLRDRGMSTAEYAVGTIAACAFAALLFKVVSSPEVSEMLTKLIDQALKTTG